MTQQLKETVSKKQDYKYIAEISQEIRDFFNPRFEEINDRFRNDIREYLDTFNEIDTFDVYSDCDTETRITFSSDLGDLFINVAIGIKLRKELDNETTRKYVKKDILKYIKDKLSFFSINNYEQNGYKIYWLKDEDVDNNKWSVYFD